MPRAEKDIRSLSSREDREKALQEISRLADHPFSGKLLKGRLKKARSLAFSLKSKGEYRVGYAVSENEVLVFILQPRENFYAEMERRWKELVR